MTWTDKLKAYWNDDPLRVIFIGGFAAIAAAKLIDANSQAKSRKAYARQINYRVGRR